MRTFIAASLVLVFANAVAAADEFAGFITTFEDGKMTVKKSKGTEPPEDVTLKFADTVKIVRGKVNAATMKIEAGEAFEGGKDALAKQVKDTAANVKKWTEEGKKGFGLGVFAVIVTEGDTVTEIRSPAGAEEQSSNALAGLQTVPLGDRRSLLDALAKQVKDTAANVKKWTEEGKKGFGLGVFAVIVSEGDTVTEIRVTGGGKKKHEQ